MKTLDINEISYVSGGEVGATGMGDNLSYTGYSTEQAKQCADTIMAWSGMGGLLLGSFGALGGGLGTLGGGAAAAEWSRACNPY